MEASILNSILGKNSESDPESSPDRVCEIYNRSIPENERKIINSVLDYWFGKDFDRHTTFPPAGTHPKWFGGAKEIDNEITQMFKEHMEKYFAGEYKGWEDDKDGSLAAIIMCDQFARNVYRKSAKAFENDYRVQIIVHEILEDEERYDEYKFFEKFFILVALMH